MTHPDNPTPAGPSAEEVAKMLEGVTAGPWHYRPHQHDDWGVVRGGDLGDWGGYPHLCQARDPDKLDEPTLAAHRKSGEDPWGPNARFIAWARTAVPDLSAERDALAAERDRWTKNASDVARDYVEMEARVAELEEARDGFYNDWDAALKITNRAANLMERLDDDRQAQKARAEAAEARVAELEAGRGPRDQRIERQRRELASYKTETARQKTALTTANATIAAQAAELARLRGLIRWAHDTLWELNPSNYDHDEVCKVNDAAVEVILGLAPIIGETHGRSPEW
jgi:uncharacterized coiled-coil protein SlyX